MRLSAYSGSTTWVSLASCGGSATGIAVDRYGGVYVTGLDIGGGSFGGVTLAPLGDWDGYIWKLGAADGSTDCAVSAGGFGTYITPDGLGLNSEGDVIISGGISGDAGFGGISVSVTAVNGEFVWEANGLTGATIHATAAGGDADIFGSAVAVVGNSIVVAGAFSGSSSFGSTTLTSTSGEWDSSGRTR